jgi:hypothetical protein
MTSRRESASIADSRSASGSELVALNVENLEETEDGFRIPRTARASDRNCPRDTDLSGRGGETWMRAAGTPNYDVTNGLPPSPYAATLPSRSKGLCLIRCTVLTATPNCLAITRTPGLSGSFNADRRGNSRESEISLHNV